MVCPSGFTKKDFVEAAEVRTKWRRRKQPSALRIKELSVNLEREGSL